MRQANNSPTGKPPAQSPQLAGQIVYTHFGILENARLGGILEYELDYMVKYANADIRIRLGRREVEAIVRQAHPEYGDDISSDTLVDALEEVMKSWLMATFPLLKTPLLQSLPPQIN
jgi:hypothetical protein